MTLPFDPPFASSAYKIKRARKHIADLEAITVAHIASKPVVYRPKPRESLKPEVLIEFDMDFRGPGDDYSAVFGDAIHNLRTAYDLLACDLVRVQGANVKGVYFPFAASAGELDHQIKIKKFFRAGPQAVALLKKLAPHHGGNEAMRAIHDLDVQDKHVRMLPSGISFTSPVMRMDMINGKPALIPIGGFEPTEVKLAFPAPSIFAGKEVVPILHELAKLTEGVVEAFKALSEIPGVAVDAVAAHAGPRIAFDSSELIVAAEPPEELPPPPTPDKSDAA